MLVVVTLAVLYGLMSVVAAGVLPLEQVAGQNLSETAKAIFPYGVYVIFIIGGAVFALATSLMGAITMLRYPIQQIAEDGWLPAMLLNIYLNFSCIGLVKKYPVQWKKSILHMPHWCFTILMLLSCLCAGTVVYNLLVDMPLHEMFMVLGVVVIFAAIAIIRLKTSAVKAEDLEAKKQAIVEEALQD